MVRTPQLQLLHEASARTFSSEGDLVPHRLFPQCHLHDASKIKLKHISDPPVEPYGDLTAERARSAVRYSFRGIDTSFVRCTVRNL